MQTLQKGRYAMFLRKSREDVEAERHGKYETLSLHRGELERLAQSLEISIDPEDVFEELMSGDSLAQREVCQELLHKVMHGDYAGVLVMDIQRLTRGDMIDQGTIISAFRYSKTLIITPTKTYDLASDDDGEMVEMHMMFGRREYSMINKRLTGGKERHVRQNGEYIGSIAPFGYRKVVRDRMKTLEPTEDAAMVVGWYEDIAARRTTCAAIADGLNRRGFPTARGGHWDDKTIRNILMNPINIGYVRWNQKKSVTEFDSNMRRVKVRRPSDDYIIKKGLHEPIVEEDLFEAANEVLKERSAKGKWGHELKYPLASLLVCANCGRAMARCISHAGQNIGITHAKTNRHECRMKGAKLSTVMSLLAEGLESIASDIDVEVSQGSESQGYIDRRLVELERESTAASEGVENLFRLAEKGLITDEEFAERRKRLDAHKAAANAEALKLEREMRNVSVLKERTARISKAVQMIEEYETIPAKRVNDFLKSFVSRIEYERDPETDEIRLGVVFK